MVIGEVVFVAVNASVPFERAYEVILTPPVFDGAVNETIAVVGEVDADATAVTAPGTVVKIVSVSDTKVLDRYPADDPVEKLNVAAVGLTE